MNTTPPSTTLRAIQLMVGLVLYGVSLAMLLLSSLGNSPWDVLHQGLARTFGGGTGTWSIVAGAVVLLAWIPLRQRPGIGTVGNVVVIGVVMDATLAVAATPSQVGPRMALLVAGIVLNAAATGLYIGAAFGPGPRDGLMTGLAARGISIRVARTGLEVSVLTVGWLLGGTLGVGTLAYALSIGPLAQVALGICTRGPTSPLEPPPSAFPKVEAQTYSP